MAKLLYKVDEYVNLTNLSDRSKYALIKKFEGQEKTIDDWKKLCKELKL